jgi:pimeloyl-ACP methyl ester carboxylesterase
VVKQPLIVTLMVLSGLTNGAQTPVDRNAGTHMQAKVEDVSNISQHCLGSGECYFLFVPGSLTPASRLLVTVHGISGNAREHAQRFAPLAQLSDTIVVSPLFVGEGYRDYQRLGRDGRGIRVDHALDRIVSDVSARLGIPASRFHLFGYSGGGQFAHRYAMAHPQRVASVSIGAAGWYTFPDATVRYPRGISGARGLDGVRFDPGAFLQVPASVFVGENDIDRDPELRQTDKLDRQQGGNRFERGINWIRAMREAAYRHGHFTLYSFESLPATGHSFTEAMLRGRLGEKVFQSIARNSTGPSGTNAVPADKETRHKTVSGTDASGRRRQSGSEQYKQNK